MTITQIQESLDEILDRVNADPDLARAAVSNPILALEELGYTLDPEVRFEIEDRGRFEDSKLIARRRRLRVQIFKAAGRTFDPDSPDELAAVLRDLGVRPRGGGECRLEQVRPLRTGPGREEPLEDALEPLRDQHPMMAPLLEYRRIDASRPGFAQKSLYGQLRAGKGGRLVSRVRVRRTSGTVEERPG
ncbi:MAG TPA: hypothetical protein VHK68_08700 [Gemmatimonadales bacterium]|nr:hypothetical protein [Gemmatimonadales bacterium]